MPPNRAERRKSLQESHRLGQAMAARQDPIAAPGTTDMGARPKAKLSLMGGLWKFIEHPITLAALAVIMGILGLFVYTPILGACGALFVLAFYRSEAVAGQTTKVQVLAYAVLICVISPALYGCYRLVDWKESASRQSKSAADTPQQEVNPPAGSSNVDVQKLAAATADEISKRSSGSKADEPQVVVTLRRVAALYVSHPMKSAPGGEIIRLPEWAAGVEFEVDITNTGRTEANRFSLKFPPMNQYGDYAYPMRAVPSIIHAGEHVPVGISTIGGNYDHDFFKLQLQSTFGDIVMPIKGKITYEGASRTSHQEDIEIHIRIADLPDSVYQSLLKQLDVNKS